MTTSFGALTALAVLLAAPVQARPADEGATAATATEASPATPEGGPADKAVPPPAEAKPPAQPPPAPQSLKPPAPPAQVARTATAARVPAGQWVYTQQYGWVWMPYDAAYTWVPPDGYGEPYMYVYYPLAGWTWLAAPWVWGWGPWPYFGVYGPAAFAWYGFGWWQYPQYWGYAPAYYPYRGIRPAPARPGVRPAPAPYSGALMAPRAGFTTRGGGVTVPGGGGVAVPHGGGGGRGGAPAGPGRR